MRVVLLSHLVPVPADNGAKLRILHLARALANRGELTLLCPAGERAEELRQQIGGAARVETICWPHSRQRGLAGFLAPHPRGVQPLERQAARQVADHAARAEIVIATDPALGEYLRPIRGPVRVVDIAAEHVLYAQRAMRRARAGERARWWLRLLKWQAYNRRLAAATDLWVVPGEVDQASLRAQLGETVRVAVVPNGVDVHSNAFAPNPDAPPTLAHCGALSYEPNRDALSFFCEAIWPLVLRRVPQAELIATGACDAAPAIVRQAPRLTLTGHLPDVRPVLRQARASIVPLRLGVGTRLKIVEALALGTPVVSTSVGAEGLDLRDGEHLLLADTPAAFADHVARVLTERDLRVRLAAAGRRRAEERYAWEIIGDRLVAALECRL